MTEIKKGQVTNLNNGKANISESSGMVTTEAVIPDRLAEHISIGTEVAFVAFDDNSALILSRIDGLYS